MTWALALFYVALGWRVLRHTVARGLRSTVCRFIGHDDYECKLIGTQARAWLCVRCHRCEWID